MRPHTPPPTKRFASSVRKRPGRGPVIPPSAPRPRRAGALLLVPETYYPLRSSAGALPAGAQHFLKRHRRVTEAPGMAAAALDLSLATRVKVR